MHAINDELNNGLEPVPQGLAPSRGTPDKMARRTLDPALAGKGPDGGKEKRVIVFGRGAGAFGACYIRSVPERIPQFTENTRVFV